MTVLVSVASKHGTTGDIREIVGDVFREPGRAIETHVPHDIVALDARTPVWSGALTTPMAALIRPRWRPAALTGIRVIHTAIFASVGAAILLVVWDGLWQRTGLRTLVAGAVVIGESAIYVSNNQVCPLTPLAEQLGARRGSVADIFLPDWFSRRIPVIGGSALVVGLVLNGIAWLRRHSIDSTVRWGMRATIETSGARSSGRSQTAWPFIWR